MMSPADIVRSMGQKVGDSHELEKKFSRFLDAWEVSRT